MQRERLHSIPARRLGSDGRVTVSGEGNGRSLGAPPDRPADQIAEPVSRDRAGSSARPVTIPLNATWRVNEDNLQWLLERKVSEPRKRASGWAAVSFVRTRDGLLLCIGEKCGPLSSEILAVIKALPESHARGSLSSVAYPPHHPPQLSPSAPVNGAPKGIQNGSLAVALWPLHGGAYAVTLGEEIIVARSRAPERDAARALLLRGFTGPFETTDCQTGRTRMRFPDIARAAR